MNYNNNKNNSSNIKDNKVSNFNNINYKNKNISSILEYIIDKNKEITFNSNESLGQGGFGLVFSMKYKNKNDLK